MSFNIKKYALIILPIIGQMFISTTSIAQETPINHIKTDVVLKMPLSSSMELNATLFSQSQLTLTASINGRINWIAQPGAMFKQGEPLIKMDLLPLQLKQQEQNAYIRREKINLSYLHNELQRLEKLSITKATSQFLIDQTRSQYELAQTELEIAQSKLKQIEDQISRGVIKAPFDGVTTQRLAREGSDVNRADELMDIIDIEHLEARFYVPVKYMSAIKKGDLLTISGNGQQIDAPILSKIPSADARSQTFETRVSIPEKYTNVWSVGQLVKVTMPLQHKASHLTVPRDALLLRKEGTYIVRVDKNLIAHRLPVLVGKGDRERVSIQGDLQHGDVIAVRGAERLTDGDSVTVQ